MKHDGFGRRNLLRRLRINYINAIEECMSQGDSFDTALTNVYDRFGQRIGLKQLELRYWKLSAREFRGKMLKYILNCFNWPLVFITIPLMDFCLLMRIKLSWILSQPIGNPGYFTFFHISLFSQVFVNFLAWLFKKRSQYFGPFQTHVQRIAFPFGKLSSWLLLIFNLELFSNPMLSGTASPYLATFLYTISALLYFSYNHTILSASSSK
jgi:hypothetical protein